jgi:hypothetical protein
MQKFSLTMAVLFVFILSITAQSSGPLDYRLYTTKAHPYVIPDLPNGSDFYLVIKTGHPMYVVFKGTDKGTATFYHSAPTITLTGDTVLIPNQFVGNVLVNFQKQGASQAIGLHVNYQADLQDQTIGSATYGDYPDFIWVPQGGSAKVSAGPWINLTGNPTSKYSWKNITTNLAIGNGLTDSVRIFNFGLYACATNDGAGWTIDTISILEKPTLNPTAKTLNFPTTVAGITYKLLKVNAITGNDTTWTETHNFTGDGNLKTITLTDGKYKLTVTRGIYTSTYPYGYFVVGTTTAVAAVQPSALAYIQHGNRLVFNAPVQLRYYNLQGSQIMQAQGLEFAVPAKGAVLFVATDAAGNVVKGKVVSEISK